MASAMVLGLVLCYAFGTFWFLTVYTGGSGETLLGALTLCVFPYVLPDLGKIFLALVLVSRVKKTPGPITSVFQGVDFPMQVKDRVLEALEGHRGTYFSGEAPGQRAPGQPERPSGRLSVSFGTRGIPSTQSPTGGYSLAPDSAMLSPQSIAPFLTVPGLQVEVQPVVTSTNQVLRQRAEEGAHEGLALVAVTQTAGRGRRDHSFFSPQIPAFT